MKHIILLLGLLFGGCGFIKAQETSKTIRINITNAWHKDRTSEPVVVNLQNLKIPFAVKSAKIADNGTDLPYQMDDLNEDGLNEELAFTIDIPAQTSKEIQILLMPQEEARTFTPQVYAEMLVSDKKGKHVPVQSVTIPGTSNIYSQMHHHGPA